MNRFSFLFQGANQLEMPKSFIFFLNTYLFKPIEISYLCVILFDILYQIILLEYLHFKG